MGGASHASGHAYQPLGPGSRGREYHSAAAGGVAMSSSREQERPSGEGEGRRVGRGGRKVGGGEGRGGG